MRTPRHVVNVMRPTTAHNDGGQLQGQPETLVKNWPCSIDPLSGSEAIRVHANFPEATLKVEGYGDPAKPLRRTDWLEMPGLGTDESGKPVIRKLFISDIQDRNQNGIHLTLICGEHAQ